MNTRIEYMYRDACNYKTFKEIVLKGAAAPGVFFAALHDGEFFIPFDVGLPELQPTPFTIDDHIWHTLERISLTDDDPDAEFSITATELANRFQAYGSTGWDQIAAFYRHGLL